MLIYNLSWENTGQEPPKISTRKRQPTRGMWHRPMRCRHPSMPQTSRLSRKPSSPRCITQNSRNDPAPHIAGMAALSFTVSSTRRYIFRNTTGEQPLFFTDKAALRCYVKLYRQCMCSCFASAPRQTKIISARPRRQASRRFACKRRH